ncbi:MAG: Gfo/Idh/MocA family oxidoreductase [Planctomycetaceae bacterium]
MSDLQVGVVGVGALGRHHARILAGMEGVTLIGIVDVRTETAVAVAEQYGCEALPDHAALLDRVDAAVIAVPTTGHLEVARDFLRRRVPLLVEKPLAADVAEAREIVEAAESHGTLLQVGHVERFNPTTRTAWPLIESPRYIRAERFSPFAFRSMDIGVVLDVMIHDVDLVLDLAKSPVCRVEAFGLSILGDKEDCVQARLTFENGCIADLSANRVHPGVRRSLTAISAERSVTVDFHAREVACYSRSDRLRYGPSPLDLAKRPDADIDALKRGMFGSFVNVERPAVPDADALTDELASFIDCVRTGRKPLVGGSEALAAMETADAILRCVDEHSWTGNAAGPVGPHLFAVDPPARRAA